MVEIESHNLDLRDDKKFLDLPPRIIVDNIFEFFEASTIDYESFDGNVSKVGLFDLFGYFKKDKLRNIWFLFSTLIIEKQKGAAILDPRKLKRISISFSNFLILSPQLIKNSILALELIWERPISLDPDFFNKIRNQNKIERLEIKQRQSSISIKFKPKKLTSLKSLTIFKVSNSISDEFIRLNSEKLEIIQCVKSNIKGNWGKLPNLKKLLVYYCPEFSFLMFETQEFLKLTEIQLKGMEFSTSIDLKKWKFIPNLKKLISTAKFRNFYDCSFCNFEKLEELDMVLEEPKEEENEEKKKKKYFRFKKLKKLTYRIIDSSANKFFMCNTFPIIEKIYVFCKSFDMDIYFDLLDDKKRIIKPHLSINNTDFLFPNQKIVDTEFDFFGNNDSQNDDIFTIGDLSFLQIKEEYLKRKVNNSLIKEIRIESYSNYGKLQQYFQIFRFPNVQKLVLDDIQNDDLQEIIVKLQRLIEIEISGNFDLFFRNNKLSKITKLSILDTNKPISGENWKELTNLKELTIKVGLMTNMEEMLYLMKQNLPLDSCFVNEIFSTIIFPNLEILHLNGLDIYKKLGNKDWKVFPKLKELHISNIDVSDEIFQEIQRFPNLEKLNICGVREDLTTFEQEKWIEFPKLKKKSILYY